MKLSPKDTTFYIGNKLPELKDFGFNPEPVKKTEPHKDAIIIIGNKKPGKNTSKALF